MTMLKVNNSIMTVGTRLKVVTQLSDLIGVVFDAAVLIKDCSVVCDDHNYFTGQLCTPAIIELPELNIRLQIDTLSNDDSQDIEKAIWEINVTPMQLWKRDYPLGELQVAHVHARTIRTTTDTYKPILLMLLNELCRN